MKPRIKVGSEYFDTWFKHIELSARLDRKYKINTDVMTPTNIDPRTGLTRYAKQL